MLSTTLYSACTIIAITMGSAILIKSFVKGMVPILFSVSFFALIENLFV